MPVFSGNLVEGYHTTDDEGDSDDEWKTIDGESNDDSDTADYSDTDDYSDTESTPESTPDEQEENPIDFYNRITSLSDSDRALLIKARIDYARQFLISYGVNADLIDEAIYLFMLTADRLIVITNASDKITPQECPFPMGFDEHVPTIYKEIEGCTYTLRACERFDPLLLDAFPISLIQ